MRLLGIGIELRPSSLLPGAALAALIYTLLPEDDQRRGATALAGGAFWYEAGVNHVAGHLISSHLAGVPMDRLRWGVFPSTLYDNNDITPQQHIGRAIGGPLGSALSMLCWWLIWRALRGRPGERLALIATLHNTFLALASFLPLPWVDGGVILKNIRRL
jgi:hypothetical protein